MNPRNRRTVVARLAADRPAQTAPPVTVGFSSQGNPQEFQMFDRTLDAFEQAQARVKVDRRYDTSLTWEKVHALILAEEAAPMLTWGTPAGWPR